MKAHCFGRTTGVSEVRQCPTCGTRMRHVQLVYRGESGRAELWLADPHNAPCGGACMIGEPAEGERIRGKFHFRRDCPACARLAAKVQTSGLTDENPGQSRGAA